MGWTCRVDASRLRVDNLRALARWFNAPAARATIGGEAGIRTLDTAFRPYNGLANRRLRPLGHLTAARFPVYTTAAVARGASSVSLLRRCSRPRRADLLEQFGGGGVELHVLARITFADRPRHRHVDRPRVHLHRRSVARENLERRHPQVRPVDQRYGAGVDDPAGGRLADDLAQLQRAIPFGEILGVGQRVLVG